MSYTTEVTRTVPFSAVSTEDVAAADNNELFTTIQNTTTDRNVSGSVAARSTTPGETVNVSKNGYVKIKIPFPFDQLPEEYVDLELVNVQITLWHLANYSHTGTTTSYGASTYVYLCKDTTQKSSSYEIASGMVTRDVTANISGQGFSKNDILDDQMYLYVRGYCKAGARYTSSLAVTEVGLEVMIPRSNITATWAYHVSPPTINGEPIIITTTL